MSPRTARHGDAPPPDATTAQGRRVRVLRVVREAAWAPVAVMLVHAVAGWRFGHEPVVDPIAHFVGGATAAWFVRRTAILCREELGSLRSLGLDLLAFGLASFAAVAWELGEGAVDLAWESAVRFSATNTLRDLALGTAGAGTYLVLRRMRGTDAS